MISDFAQRLKFFRSKLDLSQVELAKRIGISGKQVSDYEVGASKPRQATYLKLLDALQVSDNEFTSTDINHWGGLPLNLMIPIFNWVEASEISTYIPDNLRTNAIQHAYVDSNQISESYRRNMSNLFALTIQGLAMIPFLFADDLVVIDISQKVIEDGKSYLVSVTNGETTLRRCFKSPNGMIRLSPYNPSFPEFEFSSSNLVVVGEVIWRGGGVK